MPKVIKIYGPPGTGKTTTLISTLKSALASGLQPTRVAYVTHTKAACEEAKDRVASELSISKTDMKWFRTIHSLCCGMTGIHFADIWGQSDADQFHNDTGYYIRGGFDVEALEEMKPEDDGYDIVIFADQLSKATKKPLDQVIAMLPPSPKLVEPHDFLDAYGEWKQEHGKMDFTDMLLQYCNGNYGPGDVDLVIVDEAQDLSKLQWEIIEKFSSEADELHLAGDDDQSIYRFLGADEYGFLDFPADEERVLTFSHRVPYSIGEYASDVIENIKRRKIKDVEWQGEPGVINRHALDEMFLPWKEWAEGDDDVMVLTRHRRQMYDVRRMLNKMRVPHTVQGKSMATSKPGKSIRTYLESTRLGVKFRPAVMAQMLEAIGEKDLAKKTRDKGVADRKIVLNGADIGVDFYSDWPTLFSKRKWEIAQIRTLRDQINEYGIDVIGSKPNIDISTYHGSKGREAKHIVLFTDCYAATWKEQETNPDSEIRLAYVGLTRAMETVTIVTPRTNMFLRALV